MSLALLVSASLLSSPFSAYGEPSSTGNPTNLSAIRVLHCGGGQGTGWMIADNIIVTANHVSSVGGCSDVATGAPLKVYAVDEKKDMSLLTGNLPKYGQYIKYSCNGYTVGEKYDIFGWSTVGYPEIIFRQQTLTATAEMTDDRFKIDGLPSVGMRVMNGYGAPGLSGAPYIKDGVAYGLHNAGYRGFNFLMGTMLWKPAFSFELKDSILCNHG